MPYQLLYLTLGLIELGAALVIFKLRPDLRLPMFMAGLCGGMLEVVSEYWYLQDYWRPITVIPNWPLPEDFIYGFGVTALTVGIIPFMTGGKYKPLDTDRNPKAPAIRALNVFGAIMVAAAFAGMMYFSMSIGLPSIWAASTGFIGVGIGCLVAKPREIPVRILLGFMAGCIMGTMSAIGYAIGLNVVVDGDDFLRHVWLLYGTKWDARMWGNVPLDEVVWNATRGWAVMLAYLELSRKLPFIRPQR